jgi:TonB family protein
MSGLRRSDVVLILALAAAGTVVPPGTATGQESSPLVKSEVIRLLVGDAYSADERQEIVRRNCLTFSPTESDLADFRRLGASDRLLEIVRECARGEVSTSDETSTGDEISTSDIDIPPAPGGVVVSPPDVPEDGSFLGSHILPLVDRRLREPPAPDPSSVAARDDLFPEVEIPPRMENPAEVQRRLRAAVPANERHQNRVTRCVLWVFVDETGTVRSAHIEASSGSEAFDEAALEVAREMRFTPATSAGSPVAMWVQQTLSIRP